MLLLALVVYAKSKLNGSVLSFNYSWRPTRISSRCWWRTAFFRIARTSSVRDARQVAYPNSSSILPAVNTSIAAHPGLATFGSTHTICTHSLLTGVDGGTEVADAEQSPLDEALAGSSSFHSSSSRHQPQSNRGYGKASMRASTGIC